MRISPVWDTAIAMVALEEAGLPPDHPALVRAAEWLLTNQVLGPGDWQVKNPGALPGGWVFEFRNDFYPDVDDTAFVLMALQRVDYPDRRATGSGGPPRRRLAGLDAKSRRRLGRFRQEQRPRLPDADSLRRSQRHDRSLFRGRDRARAGMPGPERLVRRRIRCSQRAVAYLLRDQTDEGAWYGRWGVNYVYGTSGVLRALETIALTRSRLLPARRGLVARGAKRRWRFRRVHRFLLRRQTQGARRQHAVADGLGTDRLAGRTEHDDPAVARAVAHLVDSRMPMAPGTKNSSPAPAFPCVFYLKYHLYRNYFPLYALSRYRNLDQKVRGVPRF